MANPLIVNPYANKKYTKEELKAIPDLRPSLSEAGKGIRAFADETQATGFGLGALGAQHLKDFTGGADDGFLAGVVEAGQEGYARNIEEATAGRQAPNVGRVEDIKSFGDFVDWGVYNAAKQVPQVGMIAGGAGAGALAARALVNKGVKEAAKTGMSKEIRKEARERIQQATKRGAVVGGFAGGAGLEGGHAMGEALEAGVDPTTAKQAATAIGGINGALEFLPFYGVAKAMGAGSFAKQGIRNLIKNSPDLSKRAIALATAKEVGRRAAGTGAVGVVSEGITEGLQELVNIAGMRWAEGEEMFADLDADDWSQVKNSLAVGAFTGGGIAGGAGVFAGPQAVAPAEVAPLAPEAEVAGEAGAPTVPGTDGVQVGDPTLTPLHAERRGAEPQAVFDPQLEQQPLQGELVEDEIGTGLTPQGEQVQLANPFIEGRLSPEEVAIEEQRKLEQQPGENILQSVARPPAWHSRVARTVNAAPQAKMGGKQWEGWLKKQPGVKPEEMEDLGLKEWLDTKEGSVSKEEVEAFVAEGGVQLEEEVKKSIKPVIVTDTDILAYYAVEETTPGEFYLMHNGVPVAEAENTYAEALALGREVLEEDAELIARNNTQEAKFSEYQEPGGKNYKELLLTLPVIKSNKAKDAYKTHTLALDEKYGGLGGGFSATREHWTEAENKENNQLAQQSIKEVNNGNADVFKSSHFDEPNILAHTRFNEREDAEGNKVLFVEEVQSDWHQAGRKEGYKITGEKLDILSDMNNVLGGGDVGTTGVPDAPFKSAWPLLAMKRMIRYAVENGFDKVAWTTGQVQVDRYDLSKQVKSIFYNKTKEDSYNLTVIDLAGQEIITESDIDLNKIESLVGKELAKKIEAAEGKALPDDNNVEYRSLEGLDLKVGGEGMKNFYDKGLPRAMNKYLKQQGWGVKVGVESIKTTQTAFEQFEIEGTIYTETDFTVREEGAIREAIRQEFSFAQLAEAEGDNVFITGGAKQLLKRFGDVKATAAGQDKSMDIWAFPITQQMKDDVLTKGQPFYSETKHETTNEDVVFGEEGQNRRLYKTLGLREGGPEELKVFTEETDRVFGEGFTQKATESGLITVNQTSPEGSAAGTFNQETGEITLNLDRISKGETALSVLLHEGRHAGLEGVLGESLPLFHADLLDLASRGNKDAQHSVTRSTAAVADLLGITHEIHDLTLPPNELALEVKAVRERIMEANPNLLAEEDLAYYIQDSANNPDLTMPGLFRRLVNALKVWWVGSGIGQALAKNGLRAELTPEMAVELAKASIRKSVQEFGGKQSSLQGELQPDLQSVASTYQDAKRWWATDDEFDLGFGQRRHANLIDNLATIDKQGEAGVEVHKSAELAKSKTSTERNTINRLYLDPVVESGTKTGLSLEQIDEWFVARSILLDDENWQNVQKRSWQFAENLAKHMPHAMQKEMNAKRIALTKDKDVPINEVQDSMIDLVDEYMAQMQEMQDAGQVIPKYAEWERYRDDWAKVKAHSAGMYSPGKVNEKGELLDPSHVRANPSNAPNAQDAYKAHLGNVELQRMARKMDELGEYQLDLLVEGEKITKAEKAILRTAHPHYVKTRRESADRDKGFDFLTDPNVSTGGLKVRAGTIEYDKPVHILQNTFSQAHIFAGAAQQNLAAKHLYKEIMADKEGWKNWFNTDPKKIHRLDELGFMHDRPTTHQDPTAIPVTIIPEGGGAGQTHYIQPVQQNLRAKLFGAAMNKLGPQQQGAISKVLGFGNKIVRMAAVTFSTSFMAANLFRDPTTALYNLQATEGKEWTKEFLWGSDTNKRTGLKNAYRILYDVYIGDRTKASADNLKAVEEWEAAGGRQSFTQSLREMDSGWGSFEKEMKLMKTPGLKQLTQAGEMIEKVNILVENVSRFSAFSTVMEAWERGDIPKWQNRETARREAALISKEITTNFDRKGFSSSAIGLWHVFFNAAVQGNVQVLRNLGKSPKLQKMVVGSMVTAAMFDLIGRALFDDDDEWDNIPDYIKERNIVLPIKVGGQFIKIPSPWVYNTVWRVGGMMGEVMTGKRDAVSLPLETAQLMINTFNPVRAETWAQTLSPTTLDPFVQAVENKNWAGNPIKPTSFPGAAALPESELYWDSTPEMYKGIAKTLNALTGGDVGHSGLIDISPGVINNTVNFFTAGIGKTIGQVYNLADGVVGDHEVTVKDVPFISSYLEAPGSRVEVQLYHDHVAQILQADKTVSLYGKGKTRDREKERESKQTYRKELRMVSQAKDVERQLKSLRTRKRAAQGRKDTAGVKRVQERILAVQKRFNDTFERRMK